MIIAYKVLVIFSESIKQSFYPTGQSINFDTLDLDSLSNFRNTKTQQRKCRLRRGCGCSIDRRRRQGQPPSSLQGRIHPAPKFLARWLWLTTTDNLGAGFTAPCRASGLALHQRHALPFAGVIIASSCKLGDHNFRRLNAGRSYHSLIRMSIRSIPIIRPGNY